MKEQTEGRILPISYVYNIRDLGGYKTASNRRVKWRTIIRSGDTTEMKEAGLNYLSALPLRTIVDFRTDSEREAMPDKVPASVVNNLFLPIEAGNIGMIDPNKAEDLPKFIENAYRNMLHDSQSEFKQFFALLEDPGNTPLLFHCSAGKDRTGIAAALFLLAIEVDKETIMQDYLLSAEYLKGKYDFLLTRYPALEPLVTVRPEYLNAFFQELEEQFGGVGNYMTNILGVDTLRLKELYTEEEV